MKFEVTRSFEADFEKLSGSEQRIVLQRLPKFNAACDRYAREPSARWPTALRVKDVEGAPGIFEVTFSFSGPDIRATFEWTEVRGELAVRWRRIGGHDVFQRP